MMKTTKANQARKNRVSQGDIFREVEMVEKTVESGEVIEIHKIVFPHVVVLTQDCDLESDYTFRNKTGPNKTEDKYLISVLVAPIYTLNHFYTGEHLEYLGLKMQAFPTTSKSAIRFLKNNEIPRWHYLNFTNGIPLNESVIDFKHYFSVNVEYLYAIKDDCFVCTLDSLYREDLSVRFSAYLARIGLP